MRRTDLCWLLLLATAAEARELTLRETIYLAVRNHPATAARQLAETASRHEVSAARAGYLPMLTAQAELIAGLPGSASVLGMRGILGANQRQGPTGGAVLEQNLYDFGRTSAAVTTAQRGVERAAAEGKASLTRVAMDATGAYFACARDRSLAALYSRLVDETRSVEKEVARFVSTGQRSIVEKYLSQAQTEEVLTAASDYSRRAELGRERLAELTGAAGEPPQCPLLKDAGGEPATLTGAAHPSSPLLETAKAELAISESRVDGARAEFFPRLVGFASLRYVGDPQNGTPQSTYALGLGVVIPLFEGFRTSETLERFRAEALQREKEVDAAARAVADADLEYRRQIESAQVRADHLGKEVDLARTGFRVAKQRYLSRQGTLPDLREALRNLVRTEAQLEDSRAEVLIRGVQRDLFAGRLTP